MIVVDTNVIAYLLIPGEYTDTSEQLFRKDSEWYALRLWRSEFRSVLAKGLRAGFLLERQCFQLMITAEALMKDREFEVLSKKVLSVLVSSVASPYVCEFIALAQELDTRLITWDKQLQQISPHVAIPAATYLL